MAFSCVTGRPRIELASLSGAARKDLVTRSIRWPTGLALDWPASRLYWADARTFTVECVLLDGTDRKVVRKMGSGNTHTFNLIIHRGYGWHDGGFIPKFFPPHW